MTTEITYNTEERLFVIAGNGGVTCLGMDVCLSRIRELERRIVEWVNNLGSGTKTLRQLEIAALAVVRDVAAVKGEDIEPLALYDLYLKLLTAYEWTGDNSTWYEDNVLPGVRKTLERLIRSGRLVRIWLGDPETGECWLEEHYTIGRIGRSSGVMRIPLLVVDGECGGLALLTSNILRIRCEEDGKNLWSHPEYHLPDLTYHLGSHAKLPHEVWAGDKPHARFKSKGEAHGFIAWMHGDTFKPS